MVIGVKSAQRAILPAMLALGLQYGIQRASFANNMLPKTEGKANTAVAGKQRQGMQMNQTLQYVDSMKTVQSRKFAITTSREKGDGFMHRHDYDSAIARYTKAIDLGTDDPLAYGHRAECYVEKSNQLNPFSWNFSQAEKDAKKGVLLAEGTVLEATAKESLIITRKANDVAEWCLVAEYACLGLLVYAASRMIKSVRGMRRKKDAAV